VARSETTSGRGVVSYGTGQPDGEERSDELKVLFLEERWTILLLSQNYIFLNIVVTVASLQPSS